ncbi:hypothetical protein CW304_19060 [Bacillus sp. UFRGS-B20]|nr:hypothetical protein CW304_19060 [Bacillus sp. UFRGS-B20]
MIAKETNKTLWCLTTVIHGQFVHSVEQGSGARLQNFEFIRLLDTYMDISQVCPATLQIYTFQSSGIPKHM